MTKKPSEKRTQQLSGVQIMFAAILAIGLMLAINFSTRIANSRLQRETYANIEAEVQALQEEQATLIAELDHVQSDAYVERWARSEGKMVRPGEVLVIPVPLNTTPLVTPTPPVIVEVDTSPPKPDNWTLWWALFFDSPPPDF
ncbi:MAG: hypothetical protein CUN56_05755 [Phototrophicales bacterium]|nr:MAG: hypothetical protein CUN56_05755 [Phototrophicales bacterium]RMG74201.1 MAG: septum formation initiator family protein [Chloroflexota bacterium]